MFYVSDERKFRGYTKYPVSEKIELAKIVAKYKEEYENQTIKRYDSRRKRWVTSTPKDGVYSKAVRAFFVDLKDASFADDEFKKAVSYARRCFENYGNPDAQNDLEEPSKKRFRAEGAGRKTQAPEFRDELFQWVIGKLHPNSLAYSLDSNEYASLN